MARRSEQTPRISLNKLCEFMTVGPARQRRIIRDQKYPPDYQVVYYREAQEAIAQCIASSLEDIASIDRQIALLNQQSPDSVGAQRRLASNVDALEAFLDMIDDIDLRGATPSLGANQAPRLSVRNVEISVRPEIVLRAEGRTQPLIGGIKLHFPRTNSLNEDAAGFASAVLQEWCVATMANDGTASGPHCFVIDVGSRRVHAGVRSTARRLEGIQAACQTIHALWPTITPD